MNPSRFEIRTIDPAVSDPVRGDITNVWTEPVHHVTYYRSLRHAVGGNHFHPDHTEIIYLVNGLYELVVLDTKDPNAQKETHLIHPGQLIICRPHVAHALRYLEDSVLVGLADKPKRQEDYAKNTIKLETKLL